MSHAPPTALELAARAVKEATDELRRLTDEHGHHSDEMQRLKQPIELARDRLQRAERKLREEALR